MINKGYIRSLDIDNETLFNGDISEIFKKYIHLSTIDDNNVETIDFRGRDVRIADATGWTRLISINRQIYTGESYGFDSGLIVTKDTYIPLYDKDRSIPGFHGEVKYRYIPMQLSSETDMYIRIFDFIDDEWEKFIHPNPSVHHIEKEYVYEIHTLSGFFNCSTIHLCTSDTRNRDGKESWK